MKPAVVSTGAGMHSLFFCHCQADGSLYTNSTMHSRKHGVSNWNKKGTRQSTLNMKYPYVVTNTDDVQGECWAKRRSHVCDVPKGNMRW